MYLEKEKWDTMVACNRKPQAAYGHQIRQWCGEREGERQAEEANLETFDLLNFMSLIK